jgi:hypothetical protein
VRLFDDEINILCKRPNNLCVDTKPKRAIGIATIDGAQRRSGVHLSASPARRAANDGAGAAARQCRAFSARRAELRGVREGASAGRFDEHR